MFVVTIAVCTVFVYGLYLLEVDKTERRKRNREANHCPECDMEGVHKMDCGTGYKEKYAENEYE
jgi:hypothetical protein